MDGAVLFAIACAAAGGLLGLVAAMGNNTLRAHAGESRAEWSVREERLRRGLRGAALWRAPQVSAPGLNMLKDREFLW